MDPEVEESLSRFIGCDRWQIPHTEAGWAHGRSHSEFLATTERRSVLNPGLPEYRKILVPQTRALAELGADGIHVGRFFGRPLDFNPRSDLTPDQVTWQGGLSTLSAMLAAGRENNPNFMLFSDTASDWLMTVTPFSGTEAPARSPLRTAFPQWQPREEEKK
jgi:hypothetical protein